MRGDKAGFTLVEVLLAVLIGGMVLSSIYGVFSSVSRVSQRLESEGEQFHKVRIFFDRIGDELNSLRTVPVDSQAVWSSGTVADGSTFLEFNTERVSPFLERYGGLSRVRYEIRENEAGKTLYRSERLLLADLAATEPQPFIDKLTDFTLRYYKTGQWRESWSGTSPPQMIEIFLQIETDGRMLPFRSSFVLPGGN